MTDVRIVTQLTEALDEIRKWFPATANPPRTTESQTRVAYGSKLPIASDVLSLRSQTVDTLTSFALVVATERDLRPTMPCLRPRLRTVFGPAPREGWPWVCACTVSPGTRLLDGRLHPLGPDVAALVVFLSAHADWLAGHDPAALDELEHLAEQLEEVVRQTKPARVKIGQCPVEDCGGEIVATVRRGDTMLPSVIRCRRHPKEHVWAPHEWAALGRRARPIVDAAAARRLLVALFGADDAAASPRLDLPRSYGVAAMLDDEATLLAEHVLDGLVGDTPDDALGA